MLNKMRFNTYKDFAKHLLETFEKSTEYNIDIIAKYDESVNIIREMILLGFDVRSITIDDPDFNLYEDEYVVSLSSIDWDKELWCEPMKRKDGYVYSEAEYTYLLDTCSSKVIPYCGDHYYEVRVSEIDETESEAKSDDSDCNNCKEISYDKDGYNITVKCNVGMEEALKALDIFEKRMQSIGEMYKYMFIF